MAKNGTKLMVSVLYSYFSFTLTHLYTSIPSLMRVIRCWKWPEALSIFNSSAKLNQPKDIITWLIQNILFGSNNWKSSNISLQMFYLRFGFFISKEDLYIIKGPRIGKVVASNSFLKSSVIFNWDPVADAWGVKSAVIWKLKSNLYWVTGVL